MIREVNKPVGEVARKILSYIDSDTQMQMFGLIDPLQLFKVMSDSQSDQLLNSPSLDDPTTLRGDEYAVTYIYHTADCVIQDPSDPRYLNASVVVADINKNWNVPTETQVRWRTEWMNNPEHKVGYEKLEKLLQE